MVSAPMSLRGESTLSRETPSSTPEPCLDADEFSSRAASFHSPFGTHLMDYSDGCCALLGCSDRAKILPRSRVAPATPQAAA